MVTRVTKMAVIKVIKFNVKFNVGEILDKGMSSGDRSPKTSQMFFCFVRSLVGDSQQVDTASHCPTFSITDSDTSFEQVHII